MAQNFIQMSSRLSKLGLSCLCRGMADQIFQLPARCLDIPLPPFRRNLTSGSTRLDRGYLAAARLRQIFGLN